jgi:hypothetical protein
MKGGGILLPLKMTNNFVNLIYNPMPKTVLCWNTI